MTEHPTILITAATGTVGRQVVSQLLGIGVAVRAPVRDPDSAGLPSGVELVRGDLSDPASLAAALEGVGAVFLVWPFTAPEAAIDIAPGVVQAITEQGRRIVYLSAEAAARQPERFWGKLERLVEHSAVDWTILRPAGFGKNQEHPHVG